MMSGFEIQPAKRKAKRARIALSGPTGSGKSYTALMLATGLGKNVVAIDTEGDRLLDYSDMFEFQHLAFGPPFTPERYIEAIKTAVNFGADALVVDSISHEWFSEGGCLDLVEDAKKRFGGNKYYAWADITPRHNKFVGALLNAPLHVISTMRSKMEYVEKDGSRGKEYERVGLAAIQREGIEYEYSILGEIDIHHDMIITKATIPGLQDQVFRKPGPELAERIADWLAGAVVDEETERKHWEETLTKPTPRQTPSVTPQSTQAPEDSASVDPVALAQMNAKMIPARKKIKEAHKNHPKVVNGSIQQMTWAELQKEWPEETR